MSTINFKFSINELVKITPNQRIARVIGLSFTRGMAVNRIQVEYVDNNGLVCNHWFDETDLEINAN